MVDDENLVLQVLGHRLEHEGFTPTLIDDPTAALREIHAHPAKYRALVTDLNMPRMSGLELARWARAISPRLGIILHSSDTKRRSPHVDLVVPKLSGVSELIDGLAVLLARA
ncbi:MAG: response regulator [Polyangiaceae bacterium]|nr:response regulator [Polyangiaceae bacterium]